MANIVGELLLKFGGDATSAVREAQKVELALEGVAKVAKKTKDDLTKFTVETAGLWKGWANEIGGEVRDLWKSVEDLTKKLETQGKSLSASTTEFVTMAVQAKGAEENLKDLGKTLNAISSKLWVVTMGLQQMGRALTAIFTIPLAGIAALSIKTFADWEQATRNLQASADMTTEEADKMTASFREFAMVMPITVKELLEIAQAAAEAGVSTKNLEAYTIAIAKLVIISKELTLKTAAEALVSVSRAFGIAENNVERVGSVIRKMAKESRGGMDDFTASLLRAVPAASVLNLKFEDVSAMLAAIIPVSGTATRAGTELSTMFDQMTQKLPQLAGQMGITQESLKSMIGKDVMGTLQQYIKGLGISTDQVEKNNAVLEIFGSVGARAFRGLISQYDVFLERQDEAKQAFIDGTELTKDYEIASDTLTNTFKRFQSTVLEVAKVIGDDLNKVVSPVLEKAITLVSTLASIWVGLPKPIKEVTIAIAGVLAILGPLVLLISTLLSPLIGLVTVLAKTVGVLTVLKTTGAATAVTIAGMKTTIGALVAGMGHFLSVAIAVVAAVVLIYKVFDKLFNITDRLKEALGLKGVEDRFAEIKKKVAGALGAIEESAKEVATKAAIGFVKMATLATQWGDDVMLSFLKGFTQADFSLLNDSLKVFESYFEILEEQGKLTTEGVLANTLEARRALAAAITEAKSLGVVTAETQKRITALVGATRMKDVVGQILAEIKVTQIQDTIDALNEEIKKRRKALKKETDVIDDAIKANQRLYDDQIDSEEDQVKALQKRKRLLEKTYKTQIKALEATVEIAQGEKDAAKERLDIIKENNDVFIENLVEQKDALQENVDKTKETLQELEDLRKTEVDNAEGLLDYAKMNLEAARNQLKKEQALGHDEWDASYRAALERTSSGEKQVDLAYATYLKTKQLYAKEEKILKAELKEEQKAVDLVKDQIEAAEKAAKEQEKIYQKQVDIAEDTLKAAKKALDIFKDAYSEQADALQEEIDIRREHIDDLRDAREEILDALRKERDILSDKYEKEINLMEDRVSSAQDSLDASKKLLEAQKGINDQWLAIEKERIAAAKEMIGGTAFPGIAPIDIASTSKGLDVINEKLDDTKDKLEDLRTTAPSVFEQIGKSWKAGSWIDDFNKSIKDFNPADRIGKIIRETDWGKLFGDIWKGLTDAISSIDWGTIGRTILGLLFPPYGLLLVATKAFDIDWVGIKDGLIKMVKGVNWLDVADVILQIMFPPYFILRAILSAFGIDWEAIKTWMKDTVKAIKWSEVGLTILSLLFPPFGLLYYLTKAFNIDWGKVKDDIVNFVKAIDWSQVGKTILGLLFPPLGIFWVLTSVFGIDWGRVKDDLVKTVGSVDWSQVGKTILGALFAGPVAIGNLGVQIFNAIVTGLSNLGPALQGIGTWIGETVASGVQGARDAFKWAANVVYGLWEGIGGVWSNLWDLGKQTATQIASGLSGAWNSFKNGVKNLVGALWSGVSEIWGNVWDLGKQLASNMASGLSGAWDSFKSNARNALNGIWQGVNEAWGGLYNLGKQVASNVASGLYGAWDSFKNNMRGVIGAIWNGIAERWGEFWGWGKSIAENIANGIYGAWDAIKRAASWIASVFRNFLGWWSPPKEGPMSEGDKWMPNMMKTLAEGIKASIPNLEEAISTVGNAIMGIQDINPQPIIGTQFGQGAEPYATGVAAPALAVAPAGGGQGGVGAQQVININPGMMIASKGEIRSFVRLLEGYTAVEKTRTGLPEEK